MKQSNLCILLLLLLIGSPFLYAQRSISGSLSDSKGNPIAYAHVFLKNHQRIGTVSNEEGTFSIKINQTYTEDTLVCTMLGYETLYTPLEDIENQAILLMKSLPFQMNEVTVLSDEYLRYLLKSSVQNIPNNYPENKHRVQVYSQDYTISNGVHSEIIEADLTVETEGYGAEEINSKVYINQMRKSDDNRKLTDHLYKLFASGIPYDNTPLISRNFSRFKKHEKRSLVDFKNQLDKAELSLIDQNIFAGDTILSIKVIQPLFIKSIKSKTGELFENPFFSIVSINKSDLAIIQIQYGDIYNSNGDWTIFKYRKVNERYYPVFSKHIEKHDLPNTIKLYYNVKTLFTYNIIEDSQNTTKLKKKKRIKKDTDIRSLKYKYDADFWSSYSHSLAVPSTNAVINSINSKGDIHQQFLENQRKKKRLPKQ